jgi:hypothetical protein
MEWTYLYVDFYIYRKMVCVRGIRRMKNIKTGQILPTSYGCDIFDMPLAFFNPIGVFKYPLEEDEIEEQLEEEDDEPWFMRSEKAKLKGFENTTGISKKAFEMIFKPRDWHKMPPYSSQVKERYRL